MHVELSKETEDEFFTISEIERLIKGLSNADILRLGGISKRYARNSILDADDILNESIVIIASGSRKFPRNIALLAFLAGTMRSIASNNRRKSNKFISTINDQDNENYNDFILNIPDKNVNIESEESACQELQYVYELFKDDEDVTCLLLGKCEGLKPDEVCSTWEWDRTKYDTVQKRLRRGLNQHFPNGRIT